MNGLNMIMESEKHLNILLVLEKITLRYIFRVNKFDYYFGKTNRW